VTEQLVGSVWKIRVGCGDVSGTVKSGLSKSVAS